MRVPIPLGLLCAAALTLGTAEPSQAASQTLTVFAAASLHNAFTDIANRFEAAHPGVSVRLNFDGSQILETQIANGAPADVFASADQRSMSKATDAGLVNVPIVFARNSLVAILQFDLDIRSLRELTHDNLKLAICAEGVPCGRYTQLALQKMSADPHFWPDYGKQVQRNVVTQEQNVEGVVQKVLLGEADAGIAYASDVVQAGGIRMRNFPIPDEDQDVAAYPIAVVKGSGNAALAQAFVDYVLSADGQTLLTARGFRGRP